MNVGPTDLQTAWNALKAQTPLNISGAASYFSFDMQGQSPAYPADYCVTNPDGGMASQMEGNGLTWDFTANTSGRDVPCLQ